MSDTSNLRVPTHWGAGAVLLFVGTVAGFFLGRLTTPTSISLLNPQSEPLLQESDDEADSDLKDFKGHNEEQKLILVVRTDLGMTKGMVH
jgi:hypothetical protein